MTTRIYETRRRPSKGFGAHIAEPPVAEYVVVKYHSPKSSVVKTHHTALRKLISAELGKLPRVKAEPCPRAAHGSFLERVLTAVHLENGMEPVTKGAAEALRNRYRLSRWNERDRRVQRLRCWLSGATG